MNKTVVIRGEKYKMYQASTDWVFVRSNKKGGGTHPVALIVDGDLVKLEAVDGLSRVSNQELINAWLAS